MLYLDLSWESEQEALVAPPHAQSSHLRCSSYAAVAAKTAYEDGVPASQDIRIDEKTLTCKHGDSFIDSDGYEIVTLCSKKCLTW